MLEEFILDIKYLYQSIIRGEKPLLIEFKNKWNIKNGIGETYQKLSKRADKKETGSFYTPYEVVDFMVTELVKKIDLKNNPHVKILDPSCGGGYFLIALVDRLSMLEKGEAGETWDSSCSNENRGELEIGDNAGKVGDSSCNCGNYGELQVMGEARDSSFNYQICKERETSHAMTGECGNGKRNSGTVHANLDFMATGKTGENSFRSVDEIYKLILGNNLYGFDIDENAVMITVIELYEKTGHVARNILVRDFLLEDKDEYDFIIGNPPYMGHKVLKGEYRELLKDKYSDVFKDKGDLAYCFIKKSIDSLKAGGMLNFFTSRYILEALNGADIREYILNMGQIVRLIDFYGIRVVKGAGVDTIIIEFIKEGTGDYLYFHRLKNTAKGMGKKVFEDITQGGELQWLEPLEMGQFSHSRNHFERIEPHENHEGQLTYLDILDKKNRPNQFNGFSQETKYTKNIRLSKFALHKDGWIFLTKIEEGIIEKINGLRLSDICNSYQGIITGCDDAFVISNEESQKLNIEEELLKPWIKGRSVDKFKVDRGNELLIYSDSIENENLYPSAICYISKQRRRLEGRRECIRGVRRWFELQWGRDERIFEGVKVIFPYKASCNRFAIDEGSFFSADVYALRLNDKYITKYSYEFLTGVLNSRIYEFYIKTMAKKLGDDLYEYYPNKIMNIRIPDFIEKIEDEVKNSNIEIRNRIDKILIEHFGINEGEYEVIKQWCK